MNGKLEVGCYSCKHVYPNYQNYVEGPCMVFEEHFGEDGWEVLDFNFGCEYWKGKDENKTRRNQRAC